MLRKTCRPSQHGGGAPLPEDHCEVKQLQPCFQSVVSTVNSPGCVVALTALQLKVTCVFYLSQSGCLKM